MLRCVSFGKSICYFGTETYELTEGVQLTAVAQESSLVSVDLQTGEISTILENCDNDDLYGVWEDIAVLRVLEMQKMRRNLKTGLRSSRREQHGMSMTGSLSGFVF